MKPWEQYTEKLTRHPNRFFQTYEPELSPEKVEELLKGVLEQVSAAKSLEDWQRAIQVWNETKSHIQTHLELVQLAFQCHTDDSVVEKEERRLKESVEPVVDEWNAKVREKILASPFRKDLTESLGRQYFINLQLKQDSFDPINIKLETQLNKILADYTKLTGGASFEVRGQKYPIAHYKKFSSSSDEGLRKESLLSYAGWYLNNNGKLEEIFDKSIELRGQMADVLGFKNFIPLGYKKMRRTDYGPEEVAKLREQIHEIMVPLAQKIRETQAKDLGKDQAAIWDLDYFPQWKSGDLKVPVHQQTQTAQKIYRKISPLLADHFQKMIEWNLIDLEAREGKGPGAFCMDFSDYRVPFIFLNSVNEATDITTMLHECGHAFQAWESRGIDLLELRWPTLEACEVHSMSMEFLAYPYYEEFFAPEDAEKFKKRHLADSILLLPYIAMVDEFQHLIYAGKAEGREGRAAAWVKLEDKYMPGVDFSEIPEWKRHRWSRQLHIFQAPFYYIDYAIAQIGAWQIWAQSIRNKEEAMKNYLNLCRIGGTQGLKDFFATGNLKLPFEKGVLKTLMGEILDILPLI